LLLFLPDLGDLRLQAGGYSLKQIKIATDNFNPVNKIGEGGFGPVYKVLLVLGEPCLAYA